MIILSGGDTFSSDDNAAFNIRWVPGPLTKSRLALDIGEVHGQASGITYFGNQPGSTASSLPTHAVSGTGFDSPENGFSSGLPIQDA